MSWRMLFRVASLVLAARSAARARQARQSPGSRRRPRTGLSRRIADIRRDAGIAVRAIYFGVFLAACGALLTAGTSTAVLTPRWVGIGLLLLGVVALVAAVKEGRGLRRAVMLRRLQRRDDAVRRQL